MYKLSQGQPAGAPSRDFLYPFDTPPSFSKHFLTFGHSKIFQTYLVPFLHQFWSLVSLKSLGSF